MAAADMMDVRYLYLDDEPAERPGAEPAPAPEEEWIHANENWI